MNLTKLFETQKVLRDRIGYNEPDRFNKLVLALLVELGECANEWRGFKFWSKDQEPRVNEPYHIYSVWKDEKIPDVVYKNPLLEEYVDGLHFVLELGIEIEFDYESWNIGSEKFHNITEQFLGLTKSVVEFSVSPREGNYVDMLEIYLGLGELLGFNMKEIKSAYMEKNKVNHQRQDSGY